MKFFVSFILFLAFAEDWGCAYHGKIGAPLAFVHDLLTAPTPIKLRPLDLMLIVALVASKGGRTVVPMKNALFGLIGITVFSLLHGALIGGDVKDAMWQIYLLMSAVLMAFTCAAVFKTPQDYIYLAKWLVAACAYRGVMCWISYFTWGRAKLGAEGAYLTDHDDTIGWVVTILILIVNTLYRRSTKITLRNLAFMAFTAGAIQFNSRRLAWVSLVMGLIILYFFMPDGQVKRRVNRILYLMVPLIVIYVIVGWGKSSPIFLPLRAFATVSTQEDSSTLARNAENLGLIATANSYGMFFGSGWGKPYICLTREYDISGAFDLWPFVPHNSILGLLAFTGMVGSAFFWYTIATCTFLNARVARLGDPLARNVALVGAAQVVVCLNQLYGDMGIFVFKSMYVIAISCGMAMTLPRATGLWGNEAPARPRPDLRPGPEPVAARS